MATELSQRCADLLTRGRALARQISSHRNGPNNWFNESDVPALQAWIASVANFFRLLATPDTYFVQESSRIVEDKQLSGGIPYHTIQKLLGLLESAEDEMKAGLMRKAEYIFVATTFDDFLEHAVEFDKAGKQIESSVLASSVFEDAVRKTATKNGVTQVGIKLDVVIDELVKRGALTPVKAKRWKTYAGIRNSSLHAQWDAFDIKDVGEMIKGVKEIVEAL